MAQGPAEQWESSVKQCGRASKALEASIALWNGAKDPMQDEAFLLVDKARDLFQMALAEEVKAYKALRGAQAQAELEFKTKPDAGELPQEQIPTADDVEVPQMEEAEA